MTYVTLQEAASAGMEMFPSGRVLVVLGVGFGKSQARNISHSLGGLRGDFLGF